MNALYIVGGLGFFALVAEIINFKRGLLWLIFAGLAVAVVFTVGEWDTTTSYYSDMLLIDNFSLAFSLLIVLITMLWLWMARDYFTDYWHRTDRTALVLFATTGGIIMVSFSNMAMLFLGIEILSISLYTLAGSKKESLSSNEGSFKYFLMGSFATGFLLLGITLIYGATGSFNLMEINTRITTDTDSLPSFFYAGVLLMFVGMVFKISAVPFHFWAPDVYEGSPVPITAFMATVVKVAAMGAFYKVFSGFAAVSDTWLSILFVIVVLTLGVANITAVYQSRVKRMLAYSSIAQVGYMLLAFAVTPQSSKGTLLYYLATYSITSLAAFGVLQKVDESESFSGLAKRNPLLATVMSVALLSLAGIPPLAGFFAKYMVFTLALSNGYVAIVVVAIIASLISVYYYFKVIIAMFANEPGTPLRVAPYYQLLLVLLLMAIVALGLIPDLLISQLGFL